MDASPRDLPTGLPTVVARPVTWLRYLPQKLHRCWVISSGAGCRGPIAVSAARPERMTADVYAGPGHETADRRLRPPAERAGKVRREAAVPSPSACPAGCLHDLVDPLVAELQGCGELAQRGAAQVQPPHRPVKLGLGDLGSMVCLDEPLLCALGRRQ